MPVTVKVYVALGVFSVVMFNVEVKLGVPVFGMKVPVAPGGRPVTPRASDGRPVVEDADTNATEIEYVFEPVVNTCRLVGDAVIVKSYTCRLTVVV